MTDENHPHPDPDDAATVNQRPPFGQPAEQPSTADETRTQWVPADRPPVESTASTAEPRGSDQPAGWFPANDPNEPRWASWDQPWDQPDGPFDQAARPDGSPAARGSSWANLHALRVLAQPFP